VWRALLVGIGGFAGSVGRYWLAGGVQRLTDLDFPAGTLAVNVAGSLLLGVLMTASIERGLLDPDLRLLVAVGFCGGFTTMSTFSFETFSLVEKGLTGLAFGNVALTLLSCLASVWAGSVLVRLLW
jgi:CrcB protein